MKTLGRCRNNIEADNVVLIDVDNYSFDNVIVLDIPESHTRKEGGSNDKSRPLRTYIYIDDDESPCKHHADAQLGNGRNFENVASSSRRYVSENASPVKLSKGKRTYSGRGFNAHLDSESSDDESPDCEFIEDFSGKLKEQWEKASLRRKGVVHKGHMSSSRSYGDVHSEFGVNKSKQKPTQDSNVNGTSHEKVFESSNRVARDVDGDKDDLPFGEIPSTSKKEENEKNDLENAATTRKKASLKRNTAVRNDHTGPSRSNGDVLSDFGVNKSKQKPTQDSNVNGTSREKSFKSSNCVARDVDGDKDDLPFDEIPSTSREEENEKNDLENAATARAKASLKRKSAVPNDHRASSRSFKDVHSDFGVNKSNQKHAQGSNVNDHTSHEKFVRSSNYDARDVGDKDDLPFGKIPSTSSEEKNENNDLENAATTRGKAALKRKSALHNDHRGSSRSFKDVHSEFGVDKRNQKHAQRSNINDHTSHEENVKSFNFDARDVDGGKDDLPLGETHSTSDEEENEKNDLENAATTDDDAPDENSIIGERERLKETDEYKQALEQELLARQKALEIQAEEARQLRRLQKRKNAECLRLLDMERRQKQRLEEIRETQKKDEENMNLKEQYRTEVIHELKRLEFICLDMASLLRGLGIQVGNGPVVLQHEVRSAYKRALLSFHPDRASGSDMRQQVEAEEKFKLISRMKEKFPL